MIEPVVLYDTCTLTNGQTQSLDASRMTPPGNRGMLVKDVVFTMRAAVVGGPSCDIQWGAIIRARIRAGRFDLSNSPVPVWLYGTVPDALVETIDQYMTPLSDSSSDIFFTTRYRWVLPKPMYLPPGASIRPLFSRDDSIISYPAGVTADTSVIVQMSARGLLLDKRLTTTHVPFVGAFVPVTGQIRSREDDLRNTLGRPWDVHRMMGRIATPGPATNGGGVTDGLAPTRYEATDTRRFRYQVKIDDNNGLAITNGFVPYCSVFPSQGRNWTFVRRLGVGDQIRITLDRLPVADAWPMVSLVGSREETV